MIAGNRHSGDSLPRARGVFSIAAFLKWASNVPPRHPPNGCEKRETVCDVVGVSLWSGPAWSRPGLREARYSDTRHPLGESVWELDSKGKPPRWLGPAASIKKFPLRALRSHTGALAVPGTQETRAGTGTPRARVVLARAGAQDARNEVVSPRCHRAIPPLHHWRSPRRNVHPERTKSTCCFLPAPVQQRVVGFRYKYTVRVLETLLRTAVRTEL